MKTYRFPLIRVPYNKSCVINTKLIHTISEKKEKEGAQLTKADIYNRIFAKINA